MHAFCPLSQRAMARNLSAALQQASGHSGPKCSDFMP